MENPLASRYTTRIMNKNDLTYTTLCVKGSRHSETTAAKTRYTSMVALAAGLLTSSPAVSPEIHRPLPPGHQPLIEPSLQTRK